MKVRLALAAACAVSFAAAGGIIPTDKLPASLSLPQAVRLADGSVLTAGPYDVQIHYKGFGNAAELWFFQKGQLKGKSPAEARGFPSATPGGTASASTVKLQKADADAKIGDIKGHNTSADAKMTKIYEPAEQKNAKVFPKVEDSPPAGASQAFSWGAHGFNAGGQGKVAPTGRGLLKLSFDSANSAAGFNATLPLIEKGRK